MMYSATIGSGETTNKERDESMSTPEKTKGLSFESFMGAMKMMSNE